MDEAFALTDIMTSALIPVLQAEPRCSGMLMQHSGAGSYGLTGTCEWRCKQAAVNLQASRATCLTLDGICMLRQE